MGTPCRLSDLWKVIWQVEQECDLLHEEINGVYVWPVIRFSVVERLYRECYPVEVNAIAGGKPTVKTLFKTAVALTKQNANPFHTKKAYDTILVPFYRKQIHDGRYTEIHSQRILTENAFGRLLVLDGGDQEGMLPSAPDRDVVNRDYLWFQALIRGTAVVAAYMSGAARLRNMLAKNFMGRIGVGRTLSVFDIALRAAVFAQGRTLARKAILQSGARRLFVLIGRGAGAITAAAQDCGLRTYELQHGMICKYQAAYHYPGRPYVPYAPHTLLTYGSYWQDAVDFPVNTRTVVIGSSNLNLYRHKAADLVTRRVFIPSQGAIGNQLLQLAVETARLAPQWQFFFRPHPLEIDSMSEELRSYSALPANFYVSPPDEGFYDALSISEVQIGVYSTALFEGMALGVRTIVLDLPGAENMAQVVLSGDAVLAHDAGEVAELLASAPRCRDPEKYYAAPVPSIYAALSAAK